MDFCLLIDDLCLNCAYNAVKTLKEIARKIGKNDWDFENEDPCSGKGQWNASDKVKHFESIVDCKCHKSSCHVVSM